MVFAASARAEPIAYVAAFDATYRVDLATRQAQYLGSTGAVGGNLIGIRGMAFAPNGTLYAASDNQKVLLTLAPNGAAHVVGSLGLAGQGRGQFDLLDTSLALTCDGKAWLSSKSTQRLWRVDPDTGNSITVGPLGAAISGLAARGNELFGAGSGSDDALYRIDTQSGSAKAIGRFGAAIGSANAVTLSFSPDGTLWALINYYPPEAWSTLARIDPATGAVTILGDLTGPTGDREGLNGIAVLGFAIASPCSILAPTQAASVAVPAASYRSSVALVLALFVIGAARSRRPNRSRRRCE